jgi:hypothetical protein
MAGGVVERLGPDFIGSAVLGHVVPDRAGDSAYRKNKGILQQCTKTAASA